MQPDTPAIRTGTLSTPGVFTRWGLRLLILALVLWGSSTIYQAISMWSRWGNMDEVLVVVSETLDSTATGWLVAIKALIGLMVLGGLILLALAFGVWRRQDGAWLALVGLVLFTPFMTLISEWLIWGPQAVKSHGWAGWSLHFGYWAACGWFLVRRDTMRAFLKGEKLPWRSWWLAVPAAWIFFMALTPTTVIGLKFMLHRTEGTPFWRTDTVLKEIPAVALEEGMGEWDDGDLYGFSFALPADAQLAAFPHAQDRAWGMTALTTPDDGVREAVFVSPRGIVDLMPVSTLEKLGVSDATGYARAIYGANWSFWPLVLSHIGKRPRAVFLVEDEVRQAVAIVEEGSSSERVMMRITVQFPETDGSWEVAYGPAGIEEEWARLAARKIGWMVPQEARDFPGPMETLPTGSEDLLLLRAYWDGDLEAGLELARRLIDREQPRVWPAERLVEEIAAQAPEHSGVIELREALE